MTWRAGIASVVCGTIAGVLASAAPARAHSGPPFPIVSNRSVGAYEISIWTDPDATDDGSAAGKFWIMLDPARAGMTATLDTQAAVSVTPLDRPGPKVTGNAEPVRHDATRRFVSLVMDHEGRYGVHLAVDGPLGHAEIETAVDATYDQRPRPLMLGLALMPFLLVGFLWLNLLRRRRRGR